MYTLFDIRRLVYMQNFGLYSTVHIPVQTYIEVCNTFDFHTVVSKTIGLKSRSRVSIHNNLFILSYGIYKAKSLSLQ